ncbi:MAG: efflux RND transporter periplasmic adaptor subunit [Myxococcota bacterium]
MRYPLRENSTRSFLTSLTVGLCLTMALACEEEAALEREVIRSVVTTRIEAPGERRKRVFSGTAQSRDRTELSFQVSGKIQAIHHGTGDQVPAGTLIAELEPTDFDLALREARAASSQAAAEARNASANYRRVRALYEREGVSREELDQARTAEETTQANASVASNRVRQAEQQLAYTKLYTPSDGAISAVPADAGENIQAGEPVAIFQTGGPPEVIIAMPENLIPAVNEDDPVEVGFDAFPDARYDAVVREVGIAPDEGGTTYPVTVQIDADWAQIRPGMSADVAFSFALDEQDAVILPVGAVGRDRSGHYVFVVEPEAEAETQTETARLERFGTTRKRYVEVAEIVDEGIALRDGVRGGERIVIAGVPRVQDGLRVRILDEGDWP